MSDDLFENDEIKRDINKLNRAGRKPTLRDIADVMEKHNLKLVRWEFPSSKKEKEKSAQISQEEFQFFIKNRANLAAVEKTLAIAYGEIKGALDTSQAVSSSTLHYTTMKWTLEDDWLLNILESFKNAVPDGNRSSTRLLGLNALVLDTIQFVFSAYPDRESYKDMSNAEGLKYRLEKIGNAIGDFRSLAEARLISSFEENDK